MGKAGQRNFTGISAQADITLLYLLQACKRSNFREVIVEGDMWQDFTLVYGDHREHFEVKWHNRPVSYALVRQIVDKELGKKYGENDSLKIAAKKISKEFLKDYEYIRHSLYWWHVGTDKQPIENPVIKKLLRKKWADDSIEFLLRTDIIELQEKESVRQKISEYFTLEDPVYLSVSDQKSIVARSFREIMEAGSRGGSITHEQFLAGLDRFKREIASKSESFCPEISIRNKIVNLNKFLQSESDFAVLDHPKYLTPISANSRLIFYVSDRLERSDFHVGAFEFFIRKILLKKHYVDSAIRLLEKKWQQGRVDADYLLDFVIENYSNLFYDFNYDNALRLVKEIADQDSVGNYDGKILEFLKKETLQPFGFPREERFEPKRRGWLEKELVANLVNIFYGRAADKGPLIDFIFAYFDLTGDDFDLVIETHPKIYALVKDYVIGDLKRNFDYVVGRICGQFNAVCGGKYRGYEWMGGYTSQSGHTYSLTDKGVVRLLFRPLFHDLYSRRRDDSWQFFKKKVLDKTPRGYSKKSPVFLKRALVAVILDRITDRKLSRDTRREALNYLENVLRIKRGLPGTSDIIFAELRRRDLSEIGLDGVMKLIGIDSSKYRRKGYSAGYPTNVFTIETLFQLIKVGYKPAREYFLELMRKPGFIERDREYDSFELLAKYEVPEADPDFVVEVLGNLDLESYLNSLDQMAAYDKSSILIGLIKRDWRDSKARGKQVIDRILQARNPSEGVLQFVSSIIDALSGHDSLKTYDLVKPYLEDRTTFRKVFQNSPDVRSKIVGLGEKLARGKHYDEARRIVDLCVEDTDPGTSNIPGRFNYHLEIKLGRCPMIISDVRSLVPWVLRALISSEDPPLMKYALEKTELLLDLDGQLARRLGCPEPDYYVRLQALASLGDLASYPRRQILNKYEAGLGDRVKTVAFRMLGVLEDEIKRSGIKPKAICEFLVRVFNIVRDLKTEEAKRVLQFFEKQEVEDSFCLFAYFALYRRQRFRHIPFDPAYFERKLRQICKSHNVYRSKVAWFFWNIADEDCIDREERFKQIEPYWELMFEVYDKDVFNMLYYTLEVTLTWPSKYLYHKRILKKAIRVETDHLKGTGKSSELWEPGTKIFQILKDHNVTDFLDVLVFLLDHIDENIHYYSVPQLIAMFRSISPATEKQKTMHKRVESLLGDLYPDKYGDLSA